MSSPLDRFADAAASYSSWCESGARSEQEEARAALRHLSVLYLRALDLRPLEDAEDVEADDRADDARWRTVYERSQALPFSYYRSVFDPRSIDGTEAELGDLSDDVADIYRDLSSGLGLYRAGHLDAAEWEWCWSFQNHWGRHAASALHALHCWLADEGAW